MTGSELISLSTTGKKYRDKPSVAEININLINVTVLVSNHVIVQFKL